MSKLFQSSLDGFELSAIEIPASFRTLDIRRNTCCEKLERLLLAREDGVVTISLEDFFAKACGVICSASRAVVTALSWN